MRSSTSFKPLATARCKRSLTNLPTCHKLDRTFAPKSFTTHRFRDCTPFADADFYFCGPKPFMQNMHACLQELGVDEHRVRYEFFGPKEELVTA